MKKKQLLVRCDAGSAALLARAVTEYARAAFPPGGSECAQASREALEQTARLIGRDAAGDGARIPKRQRGMLRAAVNWFCEEQPPAGVAAADLLACIRSDDT